MTLHTNKKLGIISVGGVSLNGSAEWQQIGKLPDGITPTTNSYAAMSALESTNQGNSVAVGLYVNTDGVVQARSPKSVISAAGTLVFFVE